MKYKYITKEQWTRFKLDCLEHELIVRDAKHGIEIVSEKSERPTMDEVRSRFTCFHENELNKMDVDNLNYILTSLLKTMSDIKRTYFIPGQCPECKEETLSGSIDSFEGDKRTTRISCDWCGAQHDIVYEVMEVNMVRKKFGEAKNK